MFRSVVAGMVAATAVVMMSGVGSAQAAPGDPDGRCVIDRADTARTINSLRFHCTSRQIVDLFRSSALGAAPPAGRHRLYLLPVQQRPGGGLGPYQDAKNFSDAQSTLGGSLTFGKGPQGQPWVFKDYITGPDAGAPVQFAPRSFADGEPVWTADFVRDFGGISVSTHEYRQLTPTVWLGRDFLGPGTSANPPQRGSALAFSI